jgi:hypothetical protein
MIITIFGAEMYLWGFLLILFAIGIVLSIIIWLWNNQRQRRIHSQQAGSKLLCRFYSPEGSWPELCTVYKGMVRKMEHATRGTFTSDRWVEAPKGYEQFTDIYLVLQDHCYPVRWPEGKPFSQQIIVMETSYLIGDPIPKITYNPDKWSASVYDRVTTAIMKYAFDEKTMQVITSALGDIEGRIQKLINYLKMVPLMLIGEIVLALFIIILLVVSCQNRAAIIEMHNFMLPPVP